MTVKTILRRQFTWQEWVDKSTAKTADGFKGHWGGDDWAGGSAKQAVKMARTEGYSDAVPEVESIAAAVTDTVQAQVSLETFQATWDVAGSELDISRYMAGVPECMVEAQPIKIARAGRAVRIVVPCSFHSGIDEAVVRRRGAAIMALIYVLQQLQHPLEVWASMPIDASYSDERLHYLVEVQRADQPADIGRVMYALAHPTMLRRLGFAVMDHEKADVRERFGIGSSYGRPGKLLTDDLPDDQTGTTITLPELRSNGGWSVDESVRWIEEQLDRIFKD